VRFSRSGIVASAFC